MRLMRVLCAAVAVAAAAADRGSEATITVGGRNLRVQALSDTLLRVEEIGPLGPLDNGTNLVTGRGEFNGIPLTVVGSNATATTLATATLRAVISTAHFPAPALSAGAGCAETYHYKGVEPVPPVNRAAKSPNGIHAATLADCCAACDADATCVAFVAVSSSANSTIHPAAGNSNSDIVENGESINCWPLAKSASGNGSYAVRPQGDRVIYSKFPVAPSPPPPPPPPPSLNLVLTALPSGDVLYNGRVGHDVRNEPSIPTPAELLSGAAPAVFALRDSPRFVPPPWGATPAPPNADLGPLANTSGYDTRYAPQAECYFFVIPGVDGDSRTPAGVLSGYSSFRAEFYRLTGAVPLLPDWAWGFWFTWYHPYNQSEKTAEINHFLDDHIPMDVVSLDMDWRNLTVDYLYKVNTDLFPNMTGFFDFVHSKSLKIFFNDHPAPLGVQNGKQAEAPEMSPAEIKFRWDGQTSILDMGLDFWWFDCHWKFSVPPIVLPGSTDAFDYAAWGQRVFWDVMTRFYTEDRPAVTRTVMLGCSTSDHPANHRTPVWWTGDNQYTALAQAVNDEIMGGLDFKPYVHPDCTGHHGIDESGKPYPPEVYARWVQFCSFGTIYRIHSSIYSLGRRPWTIGGNAEAIMRNFTRMRYSMIPTIVAAGAAVSASGLPMVRRLDLEWPSEPQAVRTDQYLLGDDILVAPIDPFANASQTGPFNSDRELWLPEGSWVDAFSGQVTTAPVGGKNVSLTNVPVEIAPIYHRGSGLLVTLTDDTALSTQLQDWSRLSLDVHLLAPPATSPEVVHRTLAPPEASRITAPIQLRKTAFPNGTVAVEIEGAPVGVGTWTIKAHLIDDCAFVTNSGGAEAKAVHTERQLPFRSIAPGRTLEYEVAMSPAGVRRFVVDVDHSRC